MSASDVRGYEVTGFQSTVSGRVLREPTLARPLTNTKIDVFLSGITENVRVVALRVNALTYNHLCEFAEHHVMKTLLTEKFPTVSWMPTSSMPPFFGFSCKAFTRNVLARGKTRYELSTISDEFSLTRACSRTFRGSSGRFGQCGGVFERERVSQG